MPIPYDRIIIAYKEWLGLLGYNKNTVNSMPQRIREFFNYLEREHIHSLQQIETAHIRAFYKEQKTRVSLNTGKLLSGSTINGYLRNLRLLAQYLQETEQAVLEIDIPNQPKIVPEREILSQSEINLLYNAIDESTTGLRDRAMLSVYYGCGLRSNEGIHLDISDVLLEKKVLYVRKGKFGKERYVPFVESQCHDFKNYLQYGRPQLLKQERGLAAGAEHRQEESFLLNQYGRRINYNNALNILKNLQIRTENETIQNKQIGLHTLRHSIATHLLQRKMPLESISQFLGHKTIYSTEVYTHIVTDYGKGF